MSRTSHPSTQPLAGPPAGAALAGRSLWRTVFVRGQYVSDEYREAVEGCASANVVSSACGVEVGNSQPFFLSSVEPGAAQAEVAGLLHAPAMDFDVPSTLTAPPGSAQAEVLWVSPERRGLNRVGVIRRLRWWRLQRQLAAQGLAERCTWRSLSRRRRQQTFAEAVGFDDTARHEVLAGLGPEFPGSFDELVALSEQIGVEARSGGKRELSDPWPIRVRAATQLIASTRNAHCYMEARLTWPSYQRVLAGLVRSGVVERGYLRASIRRGQSFLRLPWVAKTPEELAQPKLTERELRIRILKRELSKRWYPIQSRLHQLRWKLYGRRQWERRFRVRLHPRASASWSEEDPF